MKDKTLKAKILVQAQMDTRITANSYRLLSCLINNKEGWIVRATYYQKHFGWTDRTLSAAMKNLKEVGYLIVNETERDTKGHRVYSYKFLLPDKTQPAQKTPCQPAQKTGLDTYYLDTDASLLKKIDLKKNKSLTPSKPLAEPQSSSQEVLNSTVDKKTLLPLEPLVLREEKNNMLAEPVVFKKQIKNYKHQSLIERISQSLSTEGIISFKRDGKAVYENLNDILEYLESYLGEGGLNRFIDRLYDDQAFFFSFYNLKREGILEIKKNVPEYKSTDW